MTRLLWVVRPYRGLGAFCVLDKIRVGCYNTLDNSKGCRKAEMSDRSNPHT